MADFGLYLLAQGLLLALYYGAGMTYMPWWIVWFPTLAIGILIIAVLLFIMVAFIISLLT